MFYLFYIGSVPIKVWWVVAGLSLILGFIPFFLRARMLTLSKKKIFCFYFLGIISISLGMRLFYLLLNNPQVFFKQPSKIFAFSEIYWQGGTSLYGAALGGLFFAFGFCLRNKISFWKLADAATPSLILVVTLMRIGCFLNGCCYGKPANIPWAVIFRDPLVVAPKSVGLHPVQLYEAGANLVAFFYFLRKTKVRFDGEFILKYTIFYNLLRIVVEFWKHPIYRYKGTLFTQTQIMALVFLIISLVIFKILFTKKRCLEH